MTAGTMQLLLHMYLRPPGTPFPYEQNDLDRLYQDDLISSTVAFEAKLTEKGQAFIAMVLSTPLPVQKWCAP